MLEDVFLDIDRIDLPTVPGHRGRGRAGRRMRIGDFGVRRSWRVRVEGS
jgi:hypothetical protein